MENIHFWTTFCESLKQLGGLLLCYKFELTSQK
jgi:hypothetical protein